MVLREYLIIFPIVNLLLMVTKTSHLMILTLCWAVRTSDINVLLSLPHTFGAMVIPQV